METDDNHSEAPTISVNGTSHPILCGLCRAPIAFRGEPDADSGDVGCAACDNWADVQEAAEVVKQYVVDEGQMALNRALRDTARRSELMTFEGKTQSQQTHAFIIDLQI
ncbi:hypothetical protein [Mameliella sediminis]|uniref:hypothetical protein n=1 Tax=Mameliella sediminis TaxID=2836866 RepID=UPI001C45094E|nr:hypothetical protein [Mameliella sediminis]MBV7394578.1 hypothetical protein [Mameliella sediminis]